MERPPGNARWLSALSHLSFLISGVGIALPALVWCTQPRKNNYTARQSIQAIAFQIVIAVLGTLLSLVALIILLLAALIGGTDPISPEAFSRNLVAASLPFGVVLTILLIIPIILSVIAAISCALGRPYRYPILGNWLAKVYGWTSADESNALPDEDLRLADVLNQLSIFIPGWGMFVPIIFRVVIGRSKSRLDFDTLQAITAQALQFALVTGMSMLSLVISGPLFLMTMTTKNNVWNSPDSGGLILTLGVILLLALAWLLALTICALLQTVAIIAAVKITRGQDFSYPLIGHFIRRSTWLTPA